MKGVRYLKFEKSLQCHIKCLFSISNTVLSLKVCQGSVCSLGAEVLECSEKHSVLSS